METTPDRPVSRSMLRGLMGKCPHCGDGKLYRRYLKIQTACPACAHDLDSYPADDGPAYFTILLVGHLIIAPALFLFAPMIWKYPAWIIIPATVLPVSFVTLLILPRIKGAIVGLLYALNITRGDAHLHTADAAE